MIIPRPGAYDPLLVVDGKDDLHVIAHLSERAVPSLTFGIRDYEGIDNVLGSINGHVDTPARPAVGFVIDADRDTIQTWHRVRGEFAKAVRSVTLPGQPDPNGTIIPGNTGSGEPRVGIWIMPDNRSPGELEDFVAQMIPDNDRVWPLSRRYVDQIPQLERRFADNKTRRAQVHAWLAVQEDPRPMGLAIRTQDLQVANNLSRAFIAWLNRLFT